MKLMIVAGEASGDTHGASLMIRLKKINPDLKFYGIGGPKMLRAGLRALYPMDVLQVHGFVEVLRHLPRLYRVLWDLRDSLDTEHPDAVLLVDYPGFNLKFASHVKRRNIPVILFNSPQVWAWRKGRLKTIAQVIDKIIVLFPFEEPIYKEIGMDVTFVGHPLLDERVEDLDSQSFLQNYQLDASLPIITIVPGSRPSELVRHLPIVMQALSLLRQKLDRVQFLLPIAENLDGEQIQKMVEHDEVSVTLVRHAFLESLHVADAAIVSSGTASLQTGLVLTPFIIIYRVSALSYWIAKRLAHIPFIGMVNILAKRLIVQEALQNDLTPQRVADEILRLVNDRGYRKTMIDNLKAIRSQLGEPGAYDRAAQSIHEFLERNKGVI